MYKTGMYGGSFNPLHLGHVNAIVTASSMCEKLYIVLCNSVDEIEVDPRERMRWLKDITKDMPNVEVFQEFADNFGKDNYKWEDGRDFIVDYMKGQPDVVFCGDDYKGRNVFEPLYPESVIYYFPRDEINISSTKIRTNPYKFFEYLPNVVREYYTKKVVIIGTESCGKSTLIRNLAKVFNTTYVEELGRNVCEEAGGYENMQPRHYYEILIRHKKEEFDRLKAANKVLFIDTDSLITLYYYKLGINDEEYNDSFAQLASSMSRLNDYDLYVFLEPDVRWVQDGTRSFGEDAVREKNNRILKGIFERENINYEVVTGNYQERFIKTKRLVNNLLK